MNFRVLVVALLVPSLALAQTPPLPEPEVLTYPPGEDQVTVVRKGAPAPYDGQLFDNDTALRWAMWLKQYRARYGLDLQAEKDRCAVLVRYQSELTAIEKQRGTTISDDLRARLQASETARLKAEEELRDPPFFSRPGTWFGIGVLTTLATAVVTVVAVNQAN